MNLGIRKISVDNLIIVILSGMFVLYFGVLFNLFPLNFESLNTFFVMVLVSVTLIYTRSTGQIVLETRKDRQLSFIQKRLEYLYYPLRNYMTGTRSSNDLLILIPYSYLASSDLEVNLNKFIKSKKNPADKPKSEEMEKLRAEIKSIVDRDIEDFKKEHSNLLNK